jgi:hypothetical protein
MCSYGHEKSRPVKGGRLVLEWVMQSLKKALLDAIGKGEKTVELHGKRYFIESAPEQETATGYTFTAISPKQEPAKKP